MSASHGWYWLAMALLAGCARSRTEPPAPAVEASVILPAPESQDLELLEMVVGQVRLVEGAKTIKVDPRPLRSNPALVTLHEIDLDPDVIEPGLWRYPFEENTDSVTDLRRALLKRMGIPELA